jgi:hypothetical protein
VALVITPTAVALTGMLPAQLKLNVPVTFVEVWDEIAQVKLPQPVTDGAPVVCASLQVPMRELPVDGVVVEDFEELAELGSVEVWSKLQPMATSPTPRTPTLRTKRKNDLMRILDGSG